MRKQWTRELDGLNANAQIAHIRKILGDLGMVGRVSMEQAREIRAQRELAQELGTWLGSLSGVHKVIDTFNLPDDVQNFERAIVSGKPFKTENISGRLAKRKGSNADNANDSSGPGSESESADHEPPKMVSCSSISVPSILIFVRITRGEVSWHSYRTRAPTTNDFYIPRVTFCLMFVVGFSHPVSSLCSFEIPEVLLIAFDYR